MTQPATVGSHLLYTYQAIDGCKKTAVGQSRPAVVVRDWGSCYNILVFTDGVNDFDDKRAALLHLTSIQLSGCVAKGQLHWAGSPLEAPAAPDPEETSAPEGATESDNSSGDETTLDEPPATPAAPEKSTRPPPKKAGK